MKKVILKELSIRGIKLFDIGYIAVIYFIAAMFFAKLFDEMYGTFDEKKEKEKSVLRRTLELMGMMWLSGIVIYVVKNLVELIPFPLDGLFGFNHLLVNDLKSGSVFSFIFLFFQSYFKAKIQFYYNALYI